MGAIRHRLTRIHLWIGEALGLTHYRSCWSCRHCREHWDGDRDFIWCASDYEADGVYACTNPSEAVWCQTYEMGVWKRLKEVEDVA